MKLLEIKKIEQKPYEMNTVLLLDNWDVFWSGPKKNLSNWTKKQEN